MSNLLILDTKEDRREVFHLLHRLPPRTRIAFLQWACKQVPQGPGCHLPVPAIWKMATTLDRAYRNDAEDVRLSSEVWLDLLSLYSTYGLDPLKTAMALESLVRRLRV